MKDKVCLNHRGRRLGSVSGNALFAPGTAVAPFDTSLFLLTMIGMAWQTWIRRVLAVAAFSSLFPAAAFAHGKLKSSSPSAGAQLTSIPRELRLDFSEAPDLTFTSLRLVLAGRDVPLGKLSHAADSRRSIVAPVTAALRAGRYTMMWQIAGDDGHPVRGRVEFVILPGAAGIDTAPAGATADPRRSSTGPGDSAAMANMHDDSTSMPRGGEFDAESPGYVVLRWMQFVGVLLAVGAVTFHVFVVGFIRRDPRSAAQASEPALLAAVESRAAQIGHYAAMGLAVTLVLRLIAQSYAMHGTGGAFAPAVMFPMIAKTMWGWGWLVQLVGVVLTGVGLHRARAGSSPSAGVDGARSVRSGWWRIAALGAVLLAFSPGLSSHAAAMPKLRVLAMLADGLHVLGASSWLGTLAIVLFAGLSVALAQRGELGAAFVRDLITAFSPVALVSAGIAASTGVFAAWLHVGTVPNLWGTRYGITLLVKLAILGVVAVTGFYNWRFVQPTLGTPVATARLRRSARVEVAVALLVLLVTAVLVATPTSIGMDM